MVETFVLAPVRVVTAVVTGSTVCACPKANAKRKPRIMRILFLVILSFICAFGRRRGMVVEAGRPRSLRAVPEFRLKQKSLLQLPPGIGLSPAAPDFASITT